MKIPGNLSQRFRNLDDMKTKIALATIGLTVIISFTAFAQDSDHFDLSDHWQTHAYP